MSAKLIIRGPKIEPLAQGSIGRIEFLIKNTFSVSIWARMGTPNIQADGVYPANDSPWLEYQDGRWKRPYSNSFDVPADTTLQCALRVSVSNWAQAGDHLIELPFDYWHQNYEDGPTLDGSFQVSESDAQAT